MALGLRLTYQVSQSCLVFLTLCCASRLESAPTLPVGQVANAVETELRGIAVRTDATLFDGDQLVTRDNGYVTLRFSDGQLLQLGSNSQLTIISAASPSGITYLQAAGSFSFTATTKPIRVAVQSVIIAADRGTVGTITRVDRNAYIIFVLTGHVTVHDGRTGRTSDIPNFQPIEFVREGIETVTANIKAGTITSTSDNEPTSAPQTRTPSPVPSCEPCSTPRNGSASKIAIGALLGAGAVETVDKITQRQKPASRSSP